MKKSRIVGINGSASPNSSNLSILHYCAKLLKNHCEFSIIEDVSYLPHFKTNLTDEHVPHEIVALRKTLQEADGILISSPEYIFSIPSGLKNLFEWCVSTTVLSDKPAGVITASANGEKGQAELVLILETLQTKMSTDTNLLIKAVKGKVNRLGEITDADTDAAIRKFVASFHKLINRYPNK